VPHDMLDIRSKEIGDGPCKTHSFPRPPRQRLRTNPGSKICQQSSQI
jgi:hypothetical protein